MNNIGHRLVCLDRTKLRGGFAKHGIDEERKGRDRKDPFIHSALRNNRFMERSLIKLSLDPRLECHVGFNIATCQKLY